MRRDLYLIFLLAALVASCSQRAAPPAKKAAPAKPEGTVKVSSVPTGAAVFLRGNHRLGVTPLTLRRPDATGLKLVLVKDGYQKESFFVMVEGGQDKVEHHKLYAQQGKIVVRAGPLRGGKIMINGKYLGRVPNDTDVKAGVSHKVEVTMNNYHPYTEPVTVKAGSVYTVNAIMIPSSRPKPKRGWIELTTDAPAMIHLNGALLGSSPMPKIPVPAKTHTLRVSSKALGKEKILKVEVKEGEMKKVLVELKQ